MLPQRLWPALFGLQPAAAQHQSPLTDDAEPFWRHDGGSPIDTLEITYSGLNTFAGVPSQSCFGTEESAAERYDIAVLGAPHDTVGQQRPAR